jgi:UDP:flavonoid glycosyltransferase YjiC (YdhE family)
VHPGGAGTTAVACRAGVPQVVVPHQPDQNFWATRIASLGLGKRLPGRHLTAAALHDRLFRLLGDRGTAFRAQAMAERLRTSDGASEAADAVLA